MDRFFAETFTGEVPCYGFSMIALGCAGAMIPISAPARTAPTAAEIDAIADARIARLRQLLTVRAGRR